MVEKLSNLPNDDFFIFNTCLERRKCHRIKIIDKGKNGICCGNGHGSYDAYWGGKKLKHDAFDKNNGSEQELFFGQCKKKSSKPSGKKSRRKKRKVSSIRKKAKKNPKNKTSKKKKKKSAKKTSTNKNN